MKKYMVCVLIPFTLTFVIACNSGALKEENTNLSQEFARMQEDNSALKQKVTMLEAQLKELSETAPAIFERALQLKASGSYEAAIKALDSVVLKSSGQPIAKKAQTEIATIKSLIAKKQKEEERAKRDAFTNIGGGFGVRRVSFKTFGYGMTEVIGEIKNNSGQSYDLVNIIIALYDSEDNLLGNGIANISNLAAGSVKSFSGYAEIPVGRISRYRVQFENAI